MLSACSKFVDDYHDTSEVKEGTTRGQVQNLTANSITIRSKGGKTVTFPITGTEQYYQGGIKAGNWVYLHYKGVFWSMLQPMIQMYLMVLR